MEGDPFSYFSFLGEGEEGKVVICRSPPFFPFSSRFNEGTLFSRRGREKRSQTKEGERVTGLTLFFASKDDLNSGGEVTAPKCIAPLSANRFCMFFVSPDALASAKRRIPLPSKS